MSDASRRSTATAPTVTVGSAAHGSPGRDVDVTVRVRNVAAGPLDVQVHAIGLEPAWAAQAVTVPALAPGATAGTTLRVTPPAGAAPGDYPFLVVVESAAGRTVTDAVLTLAVADGLVAGVEPTDARGRGRRRVEVVLANTTATPAAVRLSATGHGVDVDVPHTAVEVPAAGTVRVPAVLRTVPRWVGHAQRHTFTVTVTGRGAPQQVPGTFTSRAWLGPGVLKVAAVVAVLALWVGGALVGIPRVVTALGDRDGDTLVADPGSPAADGPGDGSGDGSGTATGGDGGDAAAAPDAAPGTATLRVAGQVTGPDPGDASVQVVPTSELWGSTGAATTTGTDVPTSAAAVGRAALGAALTTALAPAAGPVAAAVGRVLAGTADAAPGKLLGTALTVEGTTGTAQRLRTTTDAAGTWAFAGLSPTTRYLVTVAKPGYRTQRYVLTGAELSAAPLRTELRAGDGVLRGLVTGPDGPVGGVELTLTDGTTTVTTRTVTEGRVGTWSVEGLSTPSTYLVTASSDRWGSTSRLVALGAAGERDVDLAVEPGVAAVTGVAVGTAALGGVGGIGGLTVTATDGTVTRTATTLTGDDAGRFVLADLPVPGTYTVTVGGPGYATVTRELDVTAAGVAGWEVAMTAVGGSVSGTVRADDGAGVTAAGLTLSDGTTTYKSMSSSDGRGSYRFVGVAAGTYVLSAEAFGYVTGHAQVEVAAGAAASSDLVLTSVPGDGLVATAGVTGRVTDASTGGRVQCLATTEPCLVTVTTTAAALDGTTRTVTTTAAPDDAYVLPADGDGGLLPGRYTLTVSVPGYETGTVAVTVPMGVVVEAATVALTPSPSLVGSVLPRVGALPTDVCVVARPAGSATTCAPATATCTGTDARCARLTQGMYELRRLPAGTWEVVVVGLPADDWVTPDPVEVVLLPGETRRYDATIERLGIIRVTTLRADATGAIDVARDASVRAEQVGGPTVRTAVSDTHGIAELRGLTPGTYRIVTSAPDDPGVEVVVERDISLNQQLDATVVLASPVGDQVVQVVVQSADDAYQALPGARVTVTGVVGYSGTTQVRRSQTFTADASGEVLVCTAATAACAGLPVLALVSGQVDIAVQADGFDAQRLGAVELGAVDRVVLTPSYQLLDASALLVPAVAAVPDLALEVVSAPPGTGTVRLTPAATGTATTHGEAPDARPATRVALTFVDTAIGVENRIRPGTYRFALRAPGWSTPTATTEVVVDVPYRTADTADTTHSQTVLLRDGGVRVTLAPDGAAPLAAARVTLSAGGAVVAQRDVTGTPVVDLGALPVGAYDLQVVAAGFRTPAPVGVEVGAGSVATPSVPLAGLGRIHGTVSTRLGAGWTVALPGAEVRAVGPADGTGSGDVTFGARSDGSGAFTLVGDLDREGLWDGDWDVTASADAHTAATVRAVVAPGTTTSHLELDPLGSTLTVRVTDAAGAAVTSGLSVRLAYSDHAVTIAPPTVDGDEFVFSGLLPLTYTLWVVPSTSEYTTVSTRVTVGPGQPGRVEVPLATPTGAVQGQVTQEAADGSTDALPGVTVTATPQGSTDGVSVTTDTDGRYLLSGLGGGTYALTFTASGTTLTRGVQVVPGQGTVLDVTFPLTRHAVTVQLTSSIGADLTGGLVTLTSATGTVLGPQPVARSGTRHVTTFPQVPPGTWTVRAAGPAGHLATVQQTVQVSGPTTVPLQLREVELRLRATGGAPAVDVTVAPTGGTPVDVRLLDGASDSVLYLPGSTAGPAAALTATTSPGWRVALSQATVPAGATQLLVTATTTPVPAVTSVSARSAGPVEVGTDLTVTVTVTTASGTPAGQVQVGVGSPSVWGAAVPLAGGTATVRVPTTGWSPGSSTLAVRYLPSSTTTWAPSSTTVGVQVQPVTVVPGPGGGGSGGDQGGGQDGAAPVDG
ncbi:carboxypeptidase regulatory-like domain-containing protein [Cellulomonas sp. KH9]|uniref:carboxypeptidase regulatory-like domain-containing protein n=1 Tax=Cellulomonas sp. KH9 TaxID=1855324 RepID=UPI0008EA6E6B|nr:carboxypeptidase regulatory-like domain-containing protein [Cellulomonas sp. KH9]SFJ70700.1 NPCBM-associated, NEW3 domain of alpha-galactosidase [Cellulomonas sp. KH9]